MDDTTHDQDTQAAEFRTIPSQATEALASSPAQDLPEAHPSDKLVTNHGFFRQAKELLDMIKFEHTVFALPFAFVGALAAARGIPPLSTLGWILGAMVGARTAAMTFNRLVDADIDAGNPRTKARALPSGRVQCGSAVALLGIASALFGFSAGMLGPLPLKLAPLALLVILGYSLCKRFTSFSHMILGLALALAPLGAWISVAGRLETPAWFLALGVLAWVAGFDILYALQDIDSDRRQGLFSLPARIGVHASLSTSRWLHLAALASWARFNVMMGVHIYPWIGWALAALILAREHWILRRCDLERLDHAFFTLNSLVGVCFFLGHLAEWLMLQTYA